jgi:transcription antitermination factor NusG
MVRVAVTHGASFLVGLRVNIVRGVHAGQNGTVEYVWDRGCTLGVRVGGKHGMIVLCLGQDVTF